MTPAVSLDVGELARHVIVRLLRIEIEIVKARGEAIGSSWDMPSLRPAMCWVTRLVRRL